MTTQLPVQYNYRQLIGCKEVMIDWALAWNTIGASHQHKLLSSACTCTLDPFQLCSIHPCMCKLCHQTLINCEWRKTHKKFIDTKLAQNGVPYDEVVQFYAGKMPYVALIELMGFPGPKNSRERNLLNVLSLMPDAQPLGHAPAVFDKSQTIDYVGMHVDGSIGTMATGCSMWSLPDARVLTCLEMAKLMGHDDTTNFSGLSETQIKKLLGMSLHVGTAGLMMSCILAGLSIGA